MKKYIIKGVSEVLDGLVVEAVPSNKQDYVFHIKRLEQQSKLFKTFSVPVDGLYIDSTKLQEWKEYNDDFKTDNPYGQFVSNGSLERDGVTLVWSLYAKAYTIKVMQGSASLYTQSFYNEEDMSNVRDLLEAIQYDKDYDMHDIVFDFKDIEIENMGQE